MHLARRSEHAKGEIRVSAKHAQKAARNDISRELSDIREGHTDRSLSKVYTWGEKYRFDNPWTSLRIGAQRWVQETRFWIHNMLHAGEGFDKDLFADTSYRVLLRTER